ncbi:hypothetical protein [Planococcus sp. CPCC 101016]|nr:hypothetical protein [Planococcus sp. CPCC 101016]
MNALILKTDGKGPFPILLMLTGSRQAGRRSHDGAISGAAAGILA